MNTKDLELETPTTRNPQTSRRQTSTPAQTHRLDVPIMFEITAEDLANAKPYTKCQGCLIYTSLIRLGYPVYSVGSSDVDFHDGNGGLITLKSDEIGCGSIGGVLNGPYRKDVVGKQIILYPL